MKRRMFFVSVFAAACLPRGEAAQGAAKVYRIGWVTAQRAASLVPYLDAFRGALTDLGYTEGGNLLIEYRYGDDAIERAAPRWSPLVTGHFNDERPQRDR